MLNRQLRIFLVVMLVGIGLLLNPLFSSGQEPANPLSPPQIQQTVDNDWKIFNIITVGEKSCITVETRSKYISRCFESPSLHISDTVTLPDGEMGGEMYITRVSAGNSVECLVTTSTLSKDNGYITCSNDIYLAP